MFTNHPNKISVRPPDLVKRDFTTQAPDRLWLADIRYCSTCEGWLYVSFILNVFSRFIVGWQIAFTRTPIWFWTHWKLQHQVGSSCMRNSDAGSHYKPLRYTDRLDIAGMVASIGGIGDSYDIAMAEALNGTFKAKLATLSGPWRILRQLELAIVEWIDWITTDDFTQRTVTSRLPNKKATDIGNKILSPRLETCKLVLQQTRDTSIQ